MDALDSSGENFHAEEIPFDAETIAVDVPYAVE
jgi:hypothetical protein